jgi:hypothetical protein
MIKFLKFSGIWHPKISVAQIFPSWQTLGNLPVGEEIPYLNNLSSHSVIKAALYLRKSVGWDLIGSYFAFGY